MKKYILFVLTLALTGLIPLPVQAQEWNAKRIAEMVGAMSWCTNNAAKNTSEASIYQSARRAGTRALEMAINDGQIQSRDTLKILRAVESEGTYLNNKLNREKCHEIWESVNDSLVFVP
ncbi:MAG: hypothetical protein WBA93_04045 [Microcoleaceae cyanobacterium]